MYRPESLPDGYYTGRGPYISSSHHHHHPSSGYPPPHARHSHPHHHTYRSRGRSPLSSIGRSSVISDDDSTYDSHSRLRWILSLGLLLPALAAVIGVVAWAVSAEVVIGARRDSALKAADAIRLSQIMNLEPESITTTSVSGFSSFPSSSSTSGPIVVVSPTTERQPTFMPPFASFSKEKKLQNINHDQTTMNVISSTTERIPEKMAKPKPSPTTSDRESPLSNEAPVNALDSSVKDAPKSVKKSAGDQVADVINRLVAQRRNSTGVRPHIVVVAPLKNHGKESKIISALITTTPVPIPVTTRKSTTKKPSTTRKAKTTTTTTEAPKTSTTTTSKPSSKKPTLTKDAETLMAAASLLAARQKYISRSDDASMMEEMEGDEYEPEPMTIAPRNLIPFKLQESQDNRGSERQSQQSHFHRQPQHSSNRMGQGPNGDPSSPIASASQPLPIHVNPAIGMGPPPQGPTHKPPPNFHEHSQSSHSHIQRFPPPPHHHHHSQPPHPHHQQFHPPGHGPHHSHHHPQMNGHPQQQPFFGPPPHFGNQGQPHFRPPPPHEQGRGGPPMNFFHAPPPSQFNPSGQASDINYGSPMMMRPPPPPPPPDDNTMVSSSAMTIPQPGEEEAESGKTAMISMSSGNPNNHYQPAESAPSKGLTFHFGGGPVGGGGQLVTSPVGIFKTLLLPLLPKPRVNLNGKVVFGVVLEKGVGFGKQKHPVVKLHPSHYYRHH